MKSRHIKWTSPTCPDPAHNTYRDAETEANKLSLVQTGRARGGGPFSHHLHSLLAAQRGGGGRVEQFTFRTQPRGLKIVSPTQPQRLYKVDGHVPFSPNPIGAPERVQDFAPISPISTGWSHSLPSSCPHSMICHTVTQSS